MNPYQLYKLNILGLIIICGILLTALYYQLFVDSVLPCALCNLQRIGFLLYGIGLLINIYSADLKGGYLLCFTSSMLGSWVALLHILVEIPPGMPQVGSAIFGIHMYGWAFAMFNLLTVYVVVIRILFTQKVDFATLKNYSWANYLTGLFLAITVSCLLSVFLETGLRPMGFAQYHYWVICKYQGDTDEECGRPTVDEIISKYRQNRAKLDNSWPNKALDKTQ